MSTVSAIRPRRTSRNAHDDDRYARVLSVLAGIELDDIPLGAYLVTEWLPAYKLEVEPTTYRSAADVVTAFIVPHLGPIPACELTRAHLRAFHQELSRTELRRGQGVLSKSTIIRIHRILSSALQRLVEAGRIPANPAWGSAPAAQV